jgi:hypothetical protein|tara:strand:+ start:515 stop:820 length:306 start_codon:yes stop_codon:yes gene_type:complete
MKRKDTIKFWNTRSLIWNHLKIQAQFQLIAEFVGGDRRTLRLTEYQRWEHVRYFRFCEARKLLKVLAATRRASGKCNCPRGSHIIITQLFPSFALKPAIPD